MIKPNVHTDRNLLFVLLPLYEIIDCCVVKDEIKHFRKKKGFTLTHDHLSRFLAEKGFHSCGVGILDGGHKWT